MIRCATTFGAEAIGLQKDIGSLVVMEHGDLVPLMRGIKRVFDPKVRSYWLYIFDHRLVGPEPFPDDQALEM